jgi:hypothetical protein
MANQPFSTDFIDDFLEPDFNAIFEELQAEIDALQAEIDAIELEIAILQEYFDTKKDGVTIVDVTKSLNFIGDVTVAQDGTNPNQANITITGGASGIDVYHDGVLEASAVTEIDFEDDLTVSIISPDRVGVSYIRPEILSYDDGSPRVNDTLFFNFAGDLTAVQNGSNINQVDVTYTRPLIETQYNYNPIVTDTLIYNFFGPVSISQDGGNPNQVNVVIQRQGTAIYNNAGTIVVTDATELEFDGDLSVTALSSARAGISYTRPLIEGYSTGVLQTTDTLKFDFSGDLIAAQDGSDPNQLNIDYTRPLIKGKDSGSLKVIDTLSFNFTGDLVAAVDGIDTNQLNVDYTRPLIETQSTFTPVLTDTLVYNFLGQVTVTQDLGNPNQANVSIDTQGIDTYDSTGTLILATSTELEADGDLIMTALNSTRSAISYTRPLIVSKSSGSTIVSDTLAINVTGDLVATASTNQLNIAYTRPTLTTSLSSSPVVTDTRTLNFTPAVSGDVSVGGAGTTATVTINSQRATVQKNSSNVTTGLTTLNFNSDDFNVTNPSTGNAAVTLRARSQSVPTRSLNTNFIISSTRDSIATYCFDLEASVGVGGGSTANVSLQISANGVSFTTVSKVAIDTSSSAVTSGNVIRDRKTLSATIFVPANYTVKLLSATTGPSGASVVINSAQQEVLL